MTPNDPARDPERNGPGTDLTRTERLRIRFLNKRTVLWILAILLLANFVVDYVISLL